MLDDCYFFNCIKAIQFLMCVNYKCFPHKSQTKQRKHNKKNDLIFYYYINNNKMEQLYLTQLTPQERKAHDIAKSHLGTSFDILRSNGYKAWINKQDKETLLSFSSSGGPSSSSSGGPSSSSSGGPPSTVQK